MKDGWIAHVFAALDSDAVAPAKRAGRVCEDIDLYLEDSGAEFTAEIDYLDYLATLRIALEEPTAGERVDVRIDCPLDERCAKACRQALGIKAPELEEAEVEAHISRVAEGPLTLTAVYEHACGAGELVRAVASVIEAVGTVLEEMDELQDPFGERDEPLDVMGTLEEALGISIDQFIDKMGDSDGLEL